MRNLFMLPVVEFRAMSEPAPNIHLRSLLVDLLLKAQLTSDPEKLDQLISECERKAARVVRLKDEWLTAAQVVERYPSIFPTEAALRNRVSRGLAPRYTKFGKHRQSRISFKVADVEAWILRNQELTHLANQSVSDRDEV